MTLADYQGLREKYDREQKWLFEGGRAQRILTLALKQFRKLSTFQIVVPNEYVGAQEIHRNLGMCVEDEVCFDEKRTISLALHALANAEVKLRGLLLLCWGDALVHSYQLLSDLEISRYVRIDDEERLPDGSLTQAFTSNAIHWGCFLSSLEELSISLPWTETEKHADDLCRALRCFIQQCPKLVKLRIFIDLWKNGMPIGSFLNTLVIPQLRELALEGIAFSDEDELVGFLKPHCARLTKVGLWDVYIGKKDTDPMYKSWKNLLIEARGWDWTALRRFKLYDANDNAFRDPQVEMSSFLRGEAGEEALLVLHRDEGYLDDF